MEIMNINWESENMAWALYFNLSWSSFYLCFMIAGVDFEVHVHNLRDVVYEEEY